MKYAQFKELHQSVNPVIIANVWDAQSAKLAEEAGCAALGTSSHAISNMMGLEDGNNMDFQTLLFFVKAIMKQALVPVSVDMESGYSKDPLVVVQNLKQLAEIGVVGVNIEDSVTNGTRTLRLLDEFLPFLETIINEIKALQLNLFINLRTDTYVTKHPEALAETIKRGIAYKNLGVDGYFVPLIQDKQEIEKVIQEVGLPLNVFAKKDGPSYEEFAAAGVHRISSGDAVYAKAMTTVSDSYKSLAQGDLKGLFS